MNFSGVVAAAMILRGAQLHPLVPAALMLLGGVAVLVVTLHRVRWPSSVSAATAYIAVGLERSDTLAMVVLTIGFGVAGARPRESRWAPIADHLEYLAVIAVLPTLGWR